MSYNKILFEIELFCSALFITFTPKTIFYFTGEEDHEAYDITLLQKMNSETANMPHMNAPKEDEMERRSEFLKFCGPMYKPDYQHFPKKRDKMINRLLLLSFICKN